MKKDSFVVNRCEEFDYQYFVEEVLRDFFNLDADQMQKLARVILSYVRFLHFSDYGEDR